MQYLYNFRMVGCAAVALTGLALLTSRTAHAQTTVGGSTAPSSMLDVRGSMSAAYNRVTADYTMTATDFYVAYAGGGAATIALPQAGSGAAPYANSLKGRLYTIKNATVSQTLTVKTFGSETIDGAGSFTVGAGQSVQLMSTGLSGSATTWEIVSFGVATTAGPATGGTGSPGVTGPSGGGSGVVTQPGTSGNSAGSYGFTTGQNNASSGSYSSVSGYGNNSAAQSSSVSGQSNTVTVGAAYALVSGYGNNASGASSVVGGQSNTASGSYSSVTGYGNNASGQSALVSGQSNTVTGNYASVSGNGNNVTGQSSLVGGQSNTASGSFSTATGNGNTASGQSSTAMGQSNKA